MRILYQRRLVSVVATVLFVSAAASAQSISGTVLDPTGAIVPNATVEIHNPVSKYDRSGTTDSSGRFVFANVPLNPYHLKVSAPGFAPYSQDVEVRSSVPMDLAIKLQVEGSVTAVTVEAGGDLVENDPISHTDVDKNLFDKLPLESQSSSLSSLVTLLPREWRLTPMACFTGWATMRKTPLRSMVSQSRINRARFSPIKSR